MTNEHTPGPWKVSNYRPNQIIPRDPRESTYNRGDNTFRPVAVIAFTHNPELDKANARLIAAAPELKDMLVKTTIFLETVVMSLTTPGSPQRAFCEGHIELNRAIITKSERGSEVHAQQTKQSK